MEKTFLMVYPTWAEAVAARRELGSLVAERYGSYRGRPTEIIVEDRRVLFTKLRNAAMTSVGLSLSGFVLNIPKSTTAVEKHEWRGVEDLLACRLLDREQDLSRHRALDPPMTSDDVESFLGLG